MISRYAAKRQIAAARAMIAWLKCSGLEDDQSRAMLARLEQTTEALALQAYTPDTNHQPQSR